MRLKKLKELLNVTPTPQREEKLSSEPSKVYSSYVHGSTAREEIKFLDSNENWL